MIDVQGSHSQPLDPLCSQRRQQHRRINSAAECNYQPNIWEARQQISQAREKPLRAERLRGFLFLGLGELAEGCDACRARRA
jgi:hypothetical protein